jgi:hypothetical protein
LKDLVRVGDLVGDEIGALATSCPYLQHRDLGQRSYVLEPDELVVVLHSQSKAHLTQHCVLWRDQLVFIIAFANT